MAIIQFVQVLLNLYILEIQKWEVKTKSMYQCTKIMINKNDHLLLLKSNNNKSNNNLN